MTLAISSQSKLTVSPGKMKEWDNGAKVTYSNSGSGENHQISVQADTNGLGKGYYSFYLYDLTARNLRSCDGISFQLQNKTTKALEINLIFTVDSHTSASMTDASYAILESTDKSIVESVTPSYGTISIPANFNGTVYVPLAKLYMSSGQNVSLTSIQSWGITAVMTENQQTRYQMDNISFLSGSVAAMKSSYFQISMVGDSQIVIPSMGSTMERYQARVKNLDGASILQLPIFYLEKQVPGVTLSKDGQLQITSNCTASSVTVCAKLPNSVTFAQQTVTLVQSSAAEKAAAVPAFSIVPKLTKPAFAVLNQWLSLIRIVAAGMAFCLLAVILKWFSDANSNYMKIQKKLYSVSLYNERKEKL